MKHLKARWLDKRKDKKMEIGKPLRVIEAVPVPEPETAPIPDKEKEKV